MSLSSGTLSCKFSVAAPWLLMKSLAAIHYHTAAHRVHSKNSCSSGLVTSESTAWAQWLALASPRRTALHMSDVYRALPAYHIHAGASIHRVSHSSDIFWASFLALSECHFVSIFIRHDPHDIWSPEFRVLTSRPVWVWYQNSTVLVVSFDVQPLPGCHLILTIAPNISGFWI